MQTDVRPVAAEAAVSLRALLDGVTRASDVVADPLHVAYLRGAADALAMVGAGCPEASELGRPERDGTAGE